MLDTSYNSKFRTRQAPSPTGYLHLGTARTVLFTKLMTMVQNGSWFLRLEDTDQNRKNVAAAKNLLEVLTTLNLAPNEGISLAQKTEKDLFNEEYQIYETGEFAPYIQSERLEIYQKQAQKLIDKRLAYWSYITPKQKEDLQNFKQVTKQPINYFKENLAIHPEFKGKEFNSELIKLAQNDTDILFQTVEKALADEAKPALMYKFQRDQKLECFDELVGKTEFDLNLEEDFTVLKSDGFPAYHFAHLVDDFAMQTTIVIRGQEWYSSLPKHITMFRDFYGDEVEIMSSNNGKNVPAYIHLPVILGETGNKKMSKRDGNVDMQRYLDEGFTREAIINYLAFLGWNPGTEKEVYLDGGDF